MPEAAIDYGEDEAVKPIEYGAEDPPFTPPVRPWVMTEQEQADMVPSGGPTRIGSTSMDIGEGPVPVFRPPPDAGMAEKIASGVWNTVAGIPNFIARPEGVATVMLPEIAAGTRAAPLIAKAMKAGFTALMTKGTAQQAGTASVTKDPQDITEAVGAGLLTGAGAAFGERLLPDQGRAAPSRVTPQPFTTPEANAGLAARARSILPEAETALAEVQPLPQPTTPEVSDASPISPPATFHGTLLPLEESARQLPAKEGGSGVQPQAVGGLPEAKIGEVALTPQPGEVDAHLAKPLTGRNWTKEALQYGASLDPAKPEHLAELKALESRYAAELAAVPKTMENFDQIGKLGNKKQWVTEAIQAAEGLEDRDVGREVLGKDYKPPFPKKELAKPLSNIPENIPDVPNQRLSKKVSASLDMPDSPLTHVEGNVGKIRLKGAASPENQQHYGEAYNKLRKSRPELFSPNGVEIDKIENSLQDAGKNVTRDQLFDTLLANHQEQVNLRAGSKEDQFQAATEKNKGKASAEPVNVGKLGVGDKFKLAGEDFEVTHIDPDTGEVTVKDGRKFGSQTIPDGAVVHADKGTVDIKEPSGEFVPEEAKGAKLAPGAKQGDLIDSTQKDTLSLQGEQGTDAERVQAQKDKAAKDKAEAAAIEKKQQLTFRAKADELANKLNKLKMGGGEVHGGLSGIAEIVWNGAINVAQGVIRAGGSVADAIKSAVDHIKANHKGDFDEDEYRKKLSDAFGETDGKPGIYGVAERVRAERAKAGQVAAVEPGEGISAADSVDLGRQLLNAGADPENALSDFEKTKKMSADDMAIVRAKGEELAKAARGIEEKFGTHSPEFKLAWDALSKWDERSKAMQTEWHKTGQAQQGETDIDTGSFTGLQRAYKEATGKEFTPEQAESAKQKAKSSREADAAAEEAKKKLFDNLGKPPVVDPVVKSIAERIISALDKTASDALARIRARKGRVMSGLDPADLADHAILGASKIAKGFVEFSRWSAEMVKDLGDYVKPHLEEIFKASDKHLDELVNKVSPEKREAVRKTVRKATPEQNLEAAKKALESHKPGTPFTPEQLKAVWSRVKEYINQGVDDFDDVRNKVATDLGLKVDDVTEALASSVPAKRLADDVWKKQQQARRVKEQAKRWVTSQSTPKYLRALSMIPKMMFGMKVGFHGTVALGTHAPMVAFQPRFWSAYVRDFGKMYKMVLSPAYYERQVQDLLRRPNYITARRVGLVNDPFSFEDYNSPDMAKYIGGLTGMGNRGYAVLKILRQDMFDQHWNRLPDSTKIPEVAKAIADGVNHATGVVKGRAPKGTNIALFAPRLMASRAAWLAVDPIKSANTFLDWKNATPGEKQFAINQLKEKAWVAGTFFGLLALNQGVLSATGSKQKVNLTDPMKGDFMKFKAAGMNFSYGNPMITMARLPVRMYRIRSSDGGKLKNLVYPDEDSYTVLGEYGRSQLSPFASLATDLWLKADWMNRPLPNSKRPVPARLRKEGVKPYTWPEFLTEEVLPIPAEEAVREVWGKNGMGMSEAQIKQHHKAWATLTVMLATGARLSDDYNAKKP